MRQKPSRWEHLDLGVGEGCAWDLGNQREGSQPWRRRKVKTSGNITPHTLSSFFPQAQLLLFSASSAQEELVLHWL